MTEIQFEWVSSTVSRCYLGKKLFTLLIKQVFTLVYGTVGVKMWTFGAIDKIFYCFAIFLMMVLLTCDWSVCVLVAYLRRLGYSRIFVMVILVSDLMCSKLKY